MYVFAKAINLQFFQRAVRSMGSARSPFRHVWSAQLKPPPLNTRRSIERKWFVRIYESAALRAYFTSLKTCPSTTLVDLLYRSALRTPLAGSCIHLKGGWLSIRSSALRCTGLRLLMHSAISLLRFLETQACRLNGKLSHEGSRRNCWDSLRESLVPNVNKLYRSLGLSVS